MTSPSKTPDAIARGQVWFVADDPAHPAIGSEIWPDRYAVIVSADPIASRSGAVSVVYATTSPSKVAGAPMSPTHVACRMSGKDAVLLCEQPTTVDKSRLQRYSHTMRASVMKKVDRALCVALNLSTTDCSAAFAKWERRISEGTSVVGDDGGMPAGEADVTRLARENALLRAERDSYRTLLRVREEVDAHGNLDV